MSWLRPRTLDGKLKVVILVTTMTALLLSTAGMVAYQLFDARESLVREMETLADVLGNNGTAALSFQQPAAGERILSSVDAKPNITAAYFLTPDQELFAAYEKESFRELQALESGHEFARGVLRLVRDVRNRDGEMLGRIQLVSNLEPVYRRVRKSVLVAAATFLICALLALRIGYRWLSYVSRPVHDLVKTAAEISHSRDYSLRATKYEDDELGRLTDSFNQMLAQIEHSDRELQHANQELGRSNADLERFAYVASHDLQEPLRIVISYSELLESDLGEQLDSDAKKFMDYVVQASRRMRTMIDALLDYSRVGTRGHGFRAFDCGHAVDAALANLQLALTECGGEVRRGELPTAFGDPTQITQVFQNLIGNALKFHRDGQTPKIEIACDEADGRFLLSVADNGIGMDPTASDRIFEVFQRLHTRTEYPGTGIGLAICRRIVERHDGEIWVESVPNEGSKFFFTLKKPEEIEDHEP